MIRADQTTRAGCDIIRSFGGDRRLFRLPLAQLRALETACGRLHDLAGRLLAGGWGVEDIRQTILLALVGGGLPQAAATDLVIAFVDGVPVVESLDLAREIVAAVLQGSAEAAADSAAEAVGGENPPPGASAGPATSPPSSPPAP